VTEVNTCVVSLFAFPAGPVCVAVTAKPFSSVPVIVKTIALVVALPDVNFNVVATLLQLSNPAAVAA